MRNCVGRIEHAFVGRRETRLTLVRPRAYHHRVGRSFFCGDEGNALVGSDIPPASSTLHAPPFCRIDERGFCRRRACRLRRLNAHSRRAQYRSWRPHQPESKRQIWLAGASAHSEQPRLGRHPYPTASGRIGRRPFHGVRFQRSGRPSRHRRNWNRKRSSPFLGSRCWVHGRRVRVPRRHSRARHVRLHLKRHLY